MVIIKALNQAIRAQQKNIAAFVGNRPELRIDKLIAAAERLLQYVSSWMCPVAQSAGGMWWLPLKRSLGS